MITNTIEATLIEQTLRITSQLVADSGCTLSDIVRVRAHVFAALVQEHSAQLLSSATGDIGPALKSLKGE